MQPLARCGVFQQQLFAAQVFNGGHGGHGGFMEAGQDEFAFARVADDIASREDAGDVSGEGIGGDLQLLFLDGQTPFQQRAKFGRYALVNPQLIAQQALVLSICI